MKSFRSLISPPSHPNSPFALQHHSQLHDSETPAQAKCHLTPSGRARKQDGTLGRIPDFSPTFRAPKSLSVRVPSHSLHPRVPMSPAGNPPPDTAAPASPSTQLIRPGQRCGKVPPRPITQDGGWGGGGKLQSCSCNMLKKNKRPLKARAAPVAPWSYARSTLTARSPSLSCVKGTQLSDLGWGISSQASTRRGCGSCLLSLPSSPTTQRCEKLV